MIFVETTHRQQPPPTRPLVWTRTAGGIWLSDYERSAGGVYATGADLDALRWRDPNSIGWTYFIGYVGMPTPETFATILPFRQKEAPK